MNRIGTTDKGVLIELTEQDVAPICIAVDMLRAALVPLANLLITGSRTAPQTGQEPDRATMPGENRPAPESAPARTPRRAAKAKAQAKASPPAGGGFGKAPREVCGKPFTRNSPIQKCCSPACVKEKARRYGRARYAEQAKAAAKPTATAKPAAKPLPRPPATPAPVDRMAAIRAADRRVAEAVAEARESGALP